MFRFSICMIRIIKTALFSIDRGLNYDMKIDFSKYILGLLLATCLSSCFVMDNPFSSVAPGTWRAILQIEPKVPFENKKGKPLPELMDIQMQEVTEGQLPFLMEVTYLDKDRFYIEIINGEERIRLDDIQFGHDRKTGKDTILINIPVYEAYIRADFEERMMAGEFVATNRKNYSIPFIARHGQNHRFTSWIFKSKAQFICSFF